MRFLGRPITEFRRFRARGEKLSCRAHLKAKCIHIRKTKWSASSRSESKQSAENTYGDRAEMRQTVSGFAKIHKELPQCGRSATNAPRAGHMRKMPKLKMVGIGDFAPSSIVQR